MDIGHLLQVQIDPLFHNIVSVYAKVLLCNASVFLIGLEVRSTAVLG